MKIAAIVFLILGILVFGLGFVKNPDHYTGEQIADKMMVWFFAAVLEIIAFLCFLIHLMASGA